MPQPHSKKEKATDCKPLSSWHDALWLLQFMYQRLTYWGNVWLCQTAGHFWDCFQSQIPVKPESQWRCSGVWRKRTIGSTPWHKALLIPSREHWRDLSFGRMPGFSPTLKRGLPPTQSVDTRTTDMEKIKELASCWHCSFTQLPRVALKSDGCITCRTIWIIFRSVGIICNKAANTVIDNYQLLLTVQHSGHKFKTTHWLWSCLILDKQPNSVWGPDLSSFVTCGGTVSSPSRDV